jgi:microcystin-dependent protein
VSDPYLGEIKLVSWSFAPRGWAFCNGQILPINQNQALFSVIGTTYGGDGQNTFALPDFRGRVPLHQGGSAVFASAGGELSHTLTVPEMALHGHGANASPATPDQPSPSGNLWAQTSSAYSTNSPNATMNGAGCAATGGGQPHPNLPPYLVLNFIIALQGIFPSRS